MAAAMEVQVVFGHKVVPYSLRPSGNSKKVSLRQTNGNLETAGKSKRNHEDKNEISIDGAFNLVELVSRSYDSVQDVRIL